ncbi:MAG: hypothetical protein QF511_09595 [Rhodospirillales bacterium]|jgi:DNA-binding CsgD family transcriptional regulator|nr:hypothetical protein [Rhodospirillales bacterium]HIJ42545.1 hypothetical protein [Rhodospirillaceae bacterium]MDP7098742.1 hypothetical protein [Rhodospirillales bacterium]MDP7215623.1 hypothetical protein [Rhodospirillales bacterium]HIJ44906.1 hypothetical protein [Rhodospirillaceae bacterium]
MPHRQTLAHCVLDHFAIGVILLDKGAKVLLLNGAARDIVERDDGLALDHGGSSLRVQSPAAASKLKEFIAAAAEKDNPGNSRPAAAMAIPRPSLKPPYPLYVAPLPLCTVCNTRRASVAVFVSDPGRRHDLSADMISRLYGLAPAEARLVAALVAGRTLKEAAAEIGTTEGTARTTLKRVFAKTGTHSQADLIRRVLTGPAALARWTAD